MAIPALANESDQSWPPSWAAPARRCAGKNSPGPKRVTPLRQSNAVIIPVGAIEQHGPHLPLAVDTQICEAVALGVSALTGVPLIPPLCYGVSGSHGDFGGTIGLRPETMIHVVEDVIDSLHDRGIRQFVLLNGHIWNSGSLDVSAEKLRVRHRDSSVRALAYVTMYPGPEVDGRVQFRASAHAREFLRDFGDVVSLP